MWYQFKAWNSNDFCGWSDNPEVIAAAVEWLNIGREVNLYDAIPISDEEAENLGLPLQADLLVTADSRVDEFKGGDSCDEGDWS